MSKVCDGALPFNVIYYHALIEEIVKEFTKQSKEVGTGISNKHFLFRNTDCFHLHQEGCDKWCTRSTPCISIKIRILNG